MVPSMGPPSAYFNAYVTFSKLRTYAGNFPIISMRAIPYESGEDCLYNKFWYLASLDHELNLKTDQY